MSDQSVSEIVAIHQQHLGRNVQRWVVGAIVVALFAMGFYQYKGYETINNNYSTTKSDLQATETELGLLATVLSPSAVTKSRAETELLLSCLYNRVDYDTDHPYDAGLFKECNALVTATIKPVKGSGSH